MNNQDGPAGLYCTVAFCTSRFMQNAQFPFNCRILYTVTVFPDINSLCDTNLTDRGDYVRCKKKGECIIKDCAAVTACCQQPK